MLLVGMNLVTVTEDILNRKLNFGVQCWANLGLFKGY